MITNNKMQVERSVLGTLLGFDSQYDIISDVLLTDDFEAGRHQLIYQAITDLAEQNEPYDFVMVSELMRERGQLADSQCPESYFAELSMATTITPRMLRSHAEIIRNRSQRRRSMNVFKQAIQSLEDGYNKTDDVNNNAVSAISALEQKEDVKEVYNLDNMMASLVERMASVGSGVKSYVETGFPELDNLMRLKTGNLCVIAARPSMGKSLLVMNMQAHLSKFRDGVSVFFSIEMEESDLMDRLTASETSIPIDNITERRMNEDQQAAFQRFATELKNMRLEVIRKPNISISQIRTHLNKMKREHGKIGSIGIDYLQIMGGLDGDDSVKKIGIVTRTLKVMGSEFGCPVFLLSQLNRSVEQRPNKRPVLSDLRDSGTIEQDADIVVFPYRDDYYKQKDGDKDLDGMADIIIAKNRNGKTGITRLSFEGHLGRFSNYMPMMDGAGSIPKFGSDL